MVVIDVLGRSLFANEAQTTLRLDKRLKFGLRNAIATLQMVMARSAVEALQSFLSPKVVARLAISTEPVGLIL
jgi:hypothetical protein